jgi:hypothetical protein
MTWLGICGSTTQLLTRFVIVASGCLRIHPQPWWTLGLAELLWPTQASDYRKLFAAPVASVR